LIIAVTSQRLQHIPIASQVCSKPITMHLHPRALVLGLFASSSLALNLTTYRGLKIDQSKLGVLQIAFNNPDSEINVWSQDALSGLTEIVQQLQNDTDTKAVVFSSEIPNHFMAHLDLLIQPFGMYTLQCAA
jgi:hypothetical protein